MNHRSLRALQMVARATLCAAALLLSPAASAEGDTRAQAAEYFDAGAQAFDAGQYAVAAEAFLKAHELAPSPALLFSAAQAYRRRYLAEPSPDALRRAVALYREYLRADPKAKRREDAMSALEALAPIEARLSAPPAPPSVAPDGTLVQIPVPGGDPGSPPPAQRTTRLLLTALPDTAQISLDGGSFQRTPVVAPAAPGDHAVRVRAEGYHEEQLTVRAVPDELIPRHVVLRPKPARLRVRGSSGARVTVDGQLRATVPTATPIEIEPGVHTITVTLPGREPFSRRLELRRDEALDLSAELPLTSQRIAAWAVLSAGAAGAVASGVLAGLALGRDAEAVELRDQRDAAGLSVDERDRFNRAVAARNDLALASGVSGGAAALALITGVGLFVLDQPEALPPPGGPSERTPRPAPRVDFTVGALSLGVRGAF